MVCRYHDLQNQALMSDFKLHASGIDEHRYAHIMLSNITVEL